jgi:hypothetical protein
MDQRDSYCPHQPPSEITAKGTGLAKQAGKEDPVELDSSLIMWSDLVGIEYVGALRRRCNTTTADVALLTADGEIL